MLAGQRPQRRHARPVGPAGVGAAVLHQHVGPFEDRDLHRRVELRKMVWPTMDETKRTTLVVVIFVAALGVFFWVIDWVLGIASRYLLGGGV